MQRWEKLGLVFRPAAERPWLTGWAAVPFLDRIDDHRCRVYFSSRDQRNRSVTGRLALDLRHPLDSAEPDLEPVVEPGRPGYFDADGAMGTELIRIGGRTHLYYIGWNRAHVVPFRNAIGLATSDDGDRFSKFASGPVLDRSIHDPCFVASNCVQPWNGGYRMWYLSCQRWEQLTDGSWRHHYNIGVADSTDGISWAPTGRTAIDFAHDGEYAISVPRVLSTAEGYRMWYSYRGGPFGSTYRIGYAESSDGESWDRLDRTVDLAPSDDGWDAEMVCYPYVFRYDGRLFMFYNGNGYGRTGFGLAVLDD